MSKLVGKLARLERALRPMRASSGSIEWHYPQGGAGTSRLLPCDLLDDHGLDRVMSVSPTNSGVRFMRIIRVFD